MACFILYFLLLLVSLISGSSSTVLSFSSYISYLTIHSSMFAVCGHCLLNIVGGKVHAELIDSKFVYFLFF